jgi:hypothetical protein
VIEYRGDNPLACYRRDDPPVSAQSAIPYPQSTTEERAMKAVSRLLLTVLLLISLPVLADVHKQIVGATETVFIEEANLAFVGRVDTGAKTSSIHAENIEVDAAGDPRGKRISFDVVTTEGLSARVETRVVSVVRVKTAEHSEHRYVVALSMKWRDTTKSVLVTLNDRGRMQYRLLLGRNWLSGDFVVDVDKNNSD